MGSPPVALESQDLLDDAKYLAAMSKGDAGAGFIQRLQNMWFVMSNKGDPKVAQEAQSLAVQLQTADFPHTVKGDTSSEVNPCEDFYEFACGGWTARNHDSIPKSQTSWALSWDRAQLDIQNSMVKLLEKDEGPAGNFFRSCKDTTLIEKEGAKPLKPWFDLIDSIENKQQSLRSVIVSLNKANLDMFFSWYIDTDSHNNEQNAFFLTQSDTSLPDETYYSEDTPEMQEHRKVFVERVGNFFKLVGREEHEAEAKLVMDFETKLSQILDDRTTAYKEHAKTTTWAEVAEMAPNFDWKAWQHSLAECTESFNGIPKFCEKDHESILAVGTPEGKPLYIRNKAFFPKLNTLLAETDIPTIKAVMRWKVVSGAAPSLSPEFEDAMLVWYKDLYGVQERSPRDRKCFFSTTGTVSWASAQLYADKLFHKPNIKAAVHMLENVRTEFLKAIPDADWMTEDNREDAKHKLKEMFFQVGIPTDKEGEPDWPKRANALNGKLGEGYFFNQEIATRLSLQHSMEKLTKTPNRRHWGGSTPLEVNAFYGPKSNGLWIPAGILQKPFFDYENSDAQNYGSVGTILGHEMSHGFDDDGRRYDAKGEMKDWWDAKTVEGFKTRSSCISTLFSKYQVLNKKVNGVLTLGEDIADAGGLKFAYRAFLAAAPEGKPRSDSEKRLFFTSFAQTWCEVDRKKSALTSVLTDEHAPGKFRVIGGLTQFKPFAEAFQCPEGSPMAPEDKTRCHLW